MIPFVFGQVETTFVKIGGETDECDVSPGCVSNYEKQGLPIRASMPNSLGIQNNPNYFNFYDAGTYEDGGGPGMQPGNWVQFVVFSDDTVDASTGLTICIWNANLKKKTSRLFFATPKS